MCSEIQDTWNKGAAAQRDQQQTVFDDRDIMVRPFTASRKGKGSGFKCTRLSSSGSWQIRSSTAGVGPNLTTQKRRELEQHFQTHNPLEFQFSKDGPAGIAAANMSLHGGAAQCVVYSVLVCAAVSARVLGNIDHQVLHNLPNILALVRFISLQILADSQIQNAHDTIVLLLPLVPGQCIQGTFSTSMAATAAHIFLSNHQRSDFCRTVTAASFPK